MANVRSYVFVALAVGASLIGAPIAGADENQTDGDHNRALDLYEHGEIRSLAEILRRVGEAAPGDIIDVSLALSSDRWIYRLQIVTADGSKVLLNVDAASTAILDDKSAGK